MRIPAQVITGVGFLGAGIITIDGNQTKGLNNATTVWSVATIGVLTGLKIIFEACTGTIAIILINITIRSVRKTIFPDRNFDDE